MIATIVVAIVTLSLALVGRSAPPADNAADVEAGRGFWSFRPRERVMPPDVERREWVRTPIDRFVLAKQHEKGLTPASIASKEKLIRRVTFDLIGLPPTPDEVEAFLSDASPSAYRRVVDRLLASPHFGERWARHWLDLARFADSNGFERDEVRPSAYHYRDFVIKALNQDLPYTTFVKWQLAGDVIDADNPLATTATGFLVAGVENLLQTLKEFERDRYDKIDDMLSTTGAALLGLTIGCARCHDHKYDPIPQRDYYRLASSFRRTISRQVTLRLGEKDVPVYAAVDTTGPIYRKTPEFEISLPAEVYFLKRGEVNGKVDVVSQSFLQVLMRDRKTESHWQRTESGRATSPRQVLSDWITDDEYGAGSLLARVIVNRLWQHHMGRGIVATPSDFGRRGTRPTHPELLDWLATELIRNGWRLKPIHRLMVTSAVYMQTYGGNAKNDVIDPENHYLWNRAPRRLEAELIRDALLATSGALERTLYGHGILDPGSRRRSIYLLVKRTAFNPMLQLFDCPDALQGVGSRSVTTVAPQALLFLNDDRVHAYAESFGRRLEESADEGRAQMLEKGFLIALSRHPEDHEVRRLRVFVERQEEAYRRSGRDGASRLAIEDFGHLLLCLNEFVYIE